VTHQLSVLAKLGSAAGRTLLACVMVALVACSGDERGSPSAAPQATRTTTPETTTPTQPDRTSSSAACQQAPGDPWGDPEMVASATTVLEDGDAVEKVEAVVYPHPDYEGDPWSQWGQGVVLPDGRHLSAIGDHLGPDGNSYVYEYSPSDRELMLITDVLGRTDHEQGTWGYGKIHGQMVLGDCGEVYFSTYWGTNDGLTYEPPYTGDLLFRLQPDARSIANLGVPVSEREAYRHWPDGRTGAWSTER
jgi:hypothetical protein